MVTASKIFSIFGAIFNVIFIALGLFLMNNGTKISFLKEMYSNYYYKEFISMGMFYMIYGSMFLFIGLLSMTFNIYTMVKLFIVKDRRRLAIPIALEFFSGNIVAAILMINIKDYHLNK